MKILAFADFPSPYRVEVFKGLSKTYNLTVFFDKMSDQNRNADWFCKDDGLNSYNLLSEQGMVAFQVALNRIREYDIVLAYDYHIKNAMKLQLACILHRVPYIMNCDGAFIRKNFFRNAVKRVLIHFAAGYFASGENAKNYFTHFGANPEKIYIHPFTSLHERDILGKPLTSMDKEKQRKEIGLENRKTVISIGQFIPRKGFETLIRSWGDLDKEYQLLIIGGGNDREKYEQMINEFNYHNVCLVGYKPKSEIVELYKAANVFVLATLEDIWGLVVNESLANGIPVVTTDRCLAGIELVKDSINGYIVPVNNEDVMHDKIKELLESNDTLEIGYRCIDSIRKYTYENVVKAHINAINDILNS